VLNLLITFLKGATLYLQLKNKSFYYDILEKSRKKCSELAKEIEELRAEGTQYSTDRADVLLLQLKSEKKYAEHLTAKYSKIDEGD
jgi:hypothetical protein